MQLTVTDRIRLAYSQVEVWFGLLLLFIGVGTFTQANWENLYFWFGPVVTVPGRIVTIYPTNVEVNEWAVWGYTYRYPAVGLEWAGTSFSSDSTRRPGQRADVEYCVAHPAISRISGTDNAPSGTTGLLVSLVFIGAGLGSSWHNGRRVRQLLAIADDAVIAKATYERTSIEKAQDSEEKSYLLHYTYQVADLRHTLHVESANSLPSRNEVLVVFQGANPANARLFSSLPTFLQKKLTFA